MDILRAMAEKRKHMGIEGMPTKQSAKKSEPVPLAGPAAGKGRKSLKEMKAEIIAKKPKAKKVKEYFEEVIERLAYDSSSDED